MLTSASTFSAAPPLVSSAHMYHFDGTICLLQEALGGHGDLVHQTVRLVLVLADTGSSTRDGSQGGKNLTPRWRCSQLALDVTLDLIC